MSSVLAVSALALTLSAVSAVETQQAADPYVGNAMCVRCHQEQQDALVAVPHGSGNAPEIAADGCQSCHGPGRSHVQSPDDESRRPSVDRLSATERTQLCTKCHVDMPAFDRTHASADFSCSSCHVLHEREPDLGVLRWQPSCIACHEGKSLFDELHDYDMAKLAAGEISCRSCHQPAHED